MIRTLGLIIRAKQKGIISSGKAVLEKLEEHGFWLSEKMKQFIELILQKPKAHHNLLRLDGPTNNCVNLLNRQNN